MSTDASATPIKKAETPDPIDSVPPTESLVRAALDDIALLVGGAAALHQLEDDLVWTLTKRMDRIRVRLLRDLKGLAHREELEPKATKPPRVHAAVEEFLIRNRTGMAEGERRAFLEICDERYLTRSTLLTSQLPVAKWHAQIGDPTVADSILDRLVHAAHRIELQGESMRKKKGGRGGKDAE